MDDTSLEDVARQLSDLEVALFLCLAAHEHCLIETTGDSIHDLGKELALVSHLVKTENHGNKRLIQPPDLFEHI